MDIVSGACNLKISWNLGVVFVFAAMTKPSDLHNAWLLSLLVK